MKQKYVPLDKRSKKKQKEYNDMQRRGWGEFSPLTRKTDNLKAYNRKKSERWHEYEPGSDFFVRRVVSGLSPLPPTAGFTRKILHRFYMPVIRHLH